MAKDDRRNQQGKSGWMFNPLNAAAAAWGAAVGLGCAMLGIRRSDRGKQAEGGVRPEPKQPEASRGVQPRPGPGGQPPQEKASESRPETSKAVPIGTPSGRRSAAGSDARRQGARPAAPVKQGTAAKSSGLSDKGGTQRPPGQAGGKSATGSGAGKPATARAKAADKPSGQRAEPSASGSAPSEAKAPQAGGGQARAAAPNGGAASPAPSRPKASEKHPAEPRPGEAARKEPPPAAEVPAMSPVTAKPQRPPALGAPRGGKADDLKQISGIGPKLEEKLNQLGIYHYSQIAGWSDSDIAWIDSELQAKGRVERDNWVTQAAALMAGVKPKGEGPAA